MHLGNQILQARKRKGLSQEAVAEKLGVSRQTISKWELDETIPDIYQAKKLALLFGLSLDELISQDIEQKEVEKVILERDDHKDEKIDWTKAWGKKYPILNVYPQLVDVEVYEKQLLVLLRDMQKRYDLNQLDSLLVLKDILGKCWKKA
ncbi:transcriptional regulator [Erysipelotrichaceae bacterium MTC7]|nr:transcriptional regulator [Erysipelotrichaceae bacterium MTC7]